MYAVCNVIFCEGESVDIDEALCSLPTTAPCVIAFGATRDTLSDVKVVVEKDNVLSMPSLSKATHFCFASYYVFNISFPQSFKPILLFMAKTSHVSYACT